MVTLPVIGAVLIEAARIIALDGDRAARELISSDEGAATR
jgi:hypothetical protein